ncbi:hypothetical protein ACQJBY_038762 [Aegilops geniculata]
MVVVIFVDPVATGHRLPQFYARSSVCLVYFIYSHQFESPRATSPGSSLLPPSAAAVLHRSRRRSALLSSQ